MQNNLSAPAGLLELWQAARYGRVLKAACVLTTHLRAKAEMQRQPHLKNQPVVIVGRGKSGAVVAANTLLRRTYARPVKRGRYADRAALECPVSGTGPCQKTVNFQ